MMALLIVGIGDCKVSRDQCDVLVTHALGSCIGVVLYDPIAKVAGLLHFMLPDSSLDLDAAARRPFLFADTGIPMLLRSTGQLGALASRLLVMVAGGAQMLDPNGTFDIGHRNQIAMREVFWKVGVAVSKEEIGGTGSRTMKIDVDGGRVQLSTSGGPEHEMLANSKKIGASDGH
jgi:chemotaxis protein CheD